MKDIQKFSNDLFSIAVQASNGEYLFDVETVARSLGFTTVAKSGNVTIRWSRVNDYLGENSPLVAKGDFISEPMVYKLAFKAGNATAEQFQDWLAVEVLPQIRKTGSYKPKKKKDEQDDLLIKRMNAEARLKNANSRQAKLFAELAKDAPTEVNRAILQDKAVEVLTGEKLLEMPTLKQKMFDSEQIATKIGILSKEDNPHKTAVSQLIQRYIVLLDDEVEYFPGATDNWSGSVTKYAESVIYKVIDWLEEHDYPAVIKGENNNYKVKYELEPEFYQMREGF